MKSIFLISFVLSFAGGEIGRINPNPYLTIYLHDFLVIGYLLFNFSQVKKIIKNLKKINKITKKLFLLLFLNIFLAIVYSLWQNQFAPTSFLYLLRAITYFLFVYCLKKNYGQKKITQVFLTASLLMLGLGLIQYCLLPDLTSLYYLGFDDHFYRLSSSLLDPNFAGLIFLFNWLFYVSQSQLNKKQLHKKNIVLSLLFLLGLMLTYSRASYVGLVLAGLYLLINSKKIQQLIIALCLILFIGLIPFLPRQSGGEGVKLERTSSIEARIISSKQFLKENQSLTVIFGQGPFNPRYRINEEGLISHARFADNFLIFLYNSFGLVGSLLIFILLGREVNKQIKDHNYWQVSILIALLSHGLFNYNLSQAFVSLLFWGFYL